MNGGMTMPAWFDLDLNKLQSVDNQGISSAVAHLGGLHCFTV